MKIDVSLKTFVIAALVLITGYLAYHLAGIFIVFFVAFIIFAGLKPIVDYLENSGIKRWGAILITYLVILALFSILFAFILDISVTQIKSIAEDFELKSESISNFVDANLPFLSDPVNAKLEEINLALADPNFFQNLTSSEAFRGLLESLPAVGRQGIGIVGSVINGLFTIFMVIFLSIYMVLPKKNFYEGLLDLLPKQYFKRLDGILDKIRIGLGSWLGGLLFLMFIIGIATYAIIMISALFVEGYQLAKFAFLLAVIAGFLEAIPNIGPLLTLILTVILALLLGTPVGVVIYLVIAFIVLQQVEGLFLVPVVMKRAVDIHPVMSILGLLAGFELTGNPVGALLAVPVIGTIQIVVLELLKDWREKEK